MLKQEMTSIKSQMVTKSYLDDKLADLRGDLVVLTRKRTQETLVGGILSRHKSVVTRRNKRFSWSHSAVGVVILSKAERTTSCKLLIRVFLLYSGHMPVSYKIYPPPTRHGML